MKKVAFFILALIFIWGCGLPQETRRGVGNEGLLILLVNPNDAEVYVDGNLVGRAEEFEKNPLELKSGTHRVEVMKAGFATDVREVYAGNQSRHTLKITLKKSP